MSKRSVGVVGTGWVGASVAISTLHAGIAEELLLSDARHEVAEGEALDLSHGSSFYPSAVVRAVASAEQMRDTDAIVVSAGRGGKPGESRLDLLRDNAAIARGIVAPLRGYRGVIVVVANPVDVITRVIADATGLPPARVIGTGTVLDTARLRQVLGRELNLSPKSVHAQVVGEHGDSEVVLWSSATVGGLPLRKVAGWDTNREPALATEVRTAAYEIIRRKGATNHAIGLTTAAVLKAVLRDQRQVLTVSRVQEGVAGVSGVALSLPAVVGAGGVAEVLEPQMSDDERAGLHKSAAVLQVAYDSVK
jgi:L-lactate dehydrogenase